ncbi:MAG: NAD(P)/FAD-dependent oxidoreductase [Proteobacteria bacterium]|nr:NAD(P)/FAD-dependent oxidoreductase [Pseudomonadota bacterium]
MNMYKNLFTPGRINSLTLKNRIIMPPMGTFMNHLSGETPEKLIEMFARRARGGAAMLITEPLFSEKQPDDVDSLRMINLNPRSFNNPKMYEWVEAVQVHDCRFCVSLTPLPQKWMLRQMQQSVSETRMDEFEAMAYQGLGVFNKLSTAEVEGHLEEFFKVAGELKGLGVDAIEINFAFICDYFSLEHFNKRTDKYGGDFDGRMRFLREMIEGTRQAVGKTFPIMLMLDADQFAPGWRTIEDTKVMAKLFEEWGIDAIRCRGGTSIQMQYDCVPYYLPKGAVAHLAAEVKKAVNIPVIANGRLADPDVAEGLLADGKADFISIARGLLADPDLPNKIRTGRADRVRKCISCNVGCLGNLMLVPIRQFRCTVNPLLGLEEKYREVPPAAKRKKVVVVGAGPGGMAAVLTAAQRGHEVVLFEKADRLGGGGQFSLACIPPFKEELFYIPEYYEREFREFDNVKCCFKTEATAEQVSKEKPDAVIIATGGAAMVPQIPGAQGGSVITYEDVLWQQKPVGSSAVIVGGGEVGCETALYLLKKGVRVTILEMLPRVVPKMNAATRNCLVKELTDGGAAMIAGALVSAIGPGKVTYTKDGKEESVEAEAVVLAIGAKPVDGLYTSLRGLVDNLYVIGDARAPRDIMHAVREGFFTAYYI